MKKIFVLLIMTITILIPTISIKAVDYQEIDAGGTWSYQYAWRNYFDTLFNFDDPTMMLMQFEVQVPAGSTEFSIYTPNIYTTLINYDYYIKSEGSFIPLTKFGAYWINYADNDVIGDYWIEDADDLDLYLTDYGGYTDCLHFEYDLSALAGSGWTEDYTFVLNFTVDPEIEYDSRSYSIDTWGGDLVYNYTRNDTVTYTTDIDTYEYYTLNFYGYDAIIIYSVPYSPVPGVYDLNPELIPTPSDSIGYKYVRQFVGWRYKNTLPFDPTTDEIETDYAIDNVIDFYPLSVYTPIESYQSDADLPTRFDALLSIFGMNNPDGYIIFYVLLHLFYIALSLTIEKLKGKTPLLFASILTTIIFMVFGMLPIYIIIPMILLYIILFGFKIIIRHKNGDTSEE